MSGPIDRTAMRTALREIALEAGAAIMAHYHSDHAPEHKDDGSPVTVADRTADSLIHARLIALAPDIPVVTEERTSEGIVPQLGARFFLVDPLDGTKEYIRRNGEFTVNIALIEAHEPTMGVVLAPALDRMFIGDTAEGRAICADADQPDRAIRVRTPAFDGWVSVGSRSHASRGDDTLTAGLAIKAHKTAGSSLKFCLVAAAEADIYARNGRTMEWDTAAGHAVLAAAGGRVLAMPEAAPLHYGKPGLENTPFVAFGATTPPGIG